MLERRPWIREGNIRCAGGPSLRLKNSYAQDDAVDKIRGRRWLLQRRGHVLVNDQPLAILIFPDHGPAEVAHLNFAGFGSHLVLKGGRAPDQVAVAMHFGIVVQSELGTLVACNHAAYTF